MNRFFSTLAFGAVIFAALPVAAQPQSRPERPYRGLFQSGVGGAEHLLTVSGSLGAGFDDDLEAEARQRNTITTGAERRRGTLGNGTGSLNYRLDTKVFGLSASAASATRYYPSADSHFMRSSRGQVSAAAKGVQLGRSTALSAAASATVEPYNFESVFPQLFGSTMAELPPRTSIGPSARITTWRTAGRPESPIAFPTGCRWLGATVIGSHRRQGVPTASFTKTLGAACPTTSVVGSICARATG